MPDPTLWWNVLQDQFKQAVTSAMSSDAMANAGTMAQEAASSMMGAVATPKPAPEAKAGAESAESKSAPAKPRAAKAKAPDKR
jgi:hypothetical protein